MAKTVIVTGASGYIGGETILKLKDHGHRVYAVDWRVPAAHLKKIPDRFYQEDFASDYSRSLLSNNNIDAVIHCAGTSLVGPSIKNPSSYYNNNFIKTHTYLEYLMSTKNPARFIFSSSAATYGEPVMVPCGEGDPPLPISPYGDSKLMVEMMLSSYQRAYGLNYVAFRYFNACGADSQARHGQEPGATHIIARVLESIRDGREFTLYGDNYPTVDGSCIRDYLHVEDIVDAHVRALDNIESGIYNLGTSTGTSNIEIIRRAEEITGKKVNLIIGPMRTGDPAMLTASADKFHRATGWQPKFTLDDIISHAWAWYTR